MIILALFENSLLVLDFVSKFSTAFERELELSMHVLSEQARFLLLLLSSTQMFPVSLITLKRRGNQCQK